MGVATSGFAWIRCCGIGTYRRIVQLYRVRDLEETFIRPFVGHCLRVREHVPSYSLERHRVCPAEETERPRGVAFLHDRVSASTPDLRGARSLDSLGHSLIEKEPNQAAQTTPGLRPSVSDL